MKETDLSKKETFSPLVPGYPLKIGGVETDNPIWLAPLAGITFASVRKFYRSLGAGLVHTEMVSALGLCHKGRKTKELLYGSDEERPVVLQIFGSNAEDIERGTDVALNIRKFEALQINNLTKNHFLAKSIFDASWGRFLQILIYSFPYAKSIYCLWYSGC